LTKPHATGPRTLPGKTGSVGKLGCALLIGMLLSLTLRVSASGSGTGEPPEQPTRGQPIDQTSVPLSNFSAAGLESGEVQGFLRTLKDAVARDDAQAIASMVAYPITVKLEGAPVTVKTPQEFVANYTHIVSEPVKQAVEQAQLDRLFVNYQGVRLGRGEIWFGGVYNKEGKPYQVKILAINN
jgi:hypothetical protein